MGEFDLSAYLRDKKASIDRALDGLVPPEGGHAAILHEAMRYSLFAGGKRLRPVLTLAAVEAVGGETDVAMNTACAMECIHTYSLIHDDLPALDNDDLRRGRPTCHREYGEAMAILAGDALLTLAFDIIARTNGASPEAMVRVVAEVARGAGADGMIGGQVVDIESEGKEISFPELEYIHTHKTGRLIRAALRSGAILGGATEGELEAISEYAGAVGLAFQILDDILDVEGSSETMGKPVGGDAKKGKATYPSLIGLSESKEMAAELIKTATTAIKGFDEKAEPLRAIAEYIIARNN
jgi:geranylgeranyl diphosphate synthase type II